MKPYRLVVRIKNNRVWESILTRWPEVRSQSDAARRLKVTPSEIGQLLNMAVWPYSEKQGAWRLSARRVARRLQLPVEWLFDPELYGRPMLATRVELAVDPLDLRALGALPAPELDPETALSQAERDDRLRGILAELTPRERHVLAQTFGLNDGHERSLREVAQAEGKSPESIRQVEAKALRKLRHPYRSHRLRELLG